MTTTTSRHADVLRSPVYDRVVVLHLTGQPLNVAGTGVPHIDRVRVLQSNDVFFWVRALCHCLGWLTRLANPQT